MAIGEVVRFWGAVNYEPQLSFYDVLFSAANKHRPNYEHWWTNRLSVILHDPDRHDLLNIAHNKALFELANPQDLDKQLAVLAKRLREVVRDLHITRLTRMGVDLLVMADCGLTFEEMVGQMASVCLPSDGRIQAITSDSAKGAGLHYDYEWKGSTAELRAFAMHKEQGLSILKQQGEHQRLFRPPVEGDDLWKFYQLIPDSFLWYDLEVYQEGDFDPEDWRKFAKDATGHAVSVFRGLKGLLLGTA